MRCPLLLVLVLGLGLVGCASPSVREEQSVRSYLRAPGDRAEARVVDLRAAIERGSVPPGTRLALVHHASRLGVGVDADGLLTVEAGENPGAASFLAAYRQLVALPERAATTAASRTMLVVLVDHTRQRDVRADFAATVASPLLASGWYVVPPEITSDLLDLIGGPVAGLQAGVIDPAALRVLGERGVVACLVLEVRDFWLHEAVVVETARFDLSYTLFATDSGEILWEHPVDGSYERREPLAPFGAGDDTFFYPSSLGAAFTDAVDFVRAVNRSVLRSVPPPTAVLAPQRADGTR
ncbi:MAG: hypothetical protein R3F56_11750 [Planctomycetota bacterium]